MAHAQCILDTYGRLGNIYCFSTATMDARTLLYVTLYVHCLSCHNQEGVCLLYGTNGIFKIILFFFEVNSQNCGKRLLASSCLSLSPSVRPSFRPSVLPSFRLSVRLTARNNSAPAGRIFMKFNIWVFIENLLWKFKFHWKPTRIVGTVHEDLRAFVINISLNSSQSEKFSDKRYRENQSRHFFNIFFLSKFVPLMRLWGKTL